ncbi:hypothetical protein ACE3NQ_24445 [Paenibacillus terreus]|uniref:Uncharacterized protein n=1 Tax=Paenibacillus terreus TaxID=1387834 RepID=A0ABV5BEC5_9BACL
MEKMMNTCFKLQVANLHHNFGSPKLPLIRAGYPLYRDVGRAEVSLSLLPVIAIQPATG